MYRLSLGSSKITLKNSLLIFSDTPFYQKNGNVSVFEPTLREIESISDLFSKTLWLSYIRGIHSENNARPPHVPSIYLKPLPDWRGGKLWIDKIKVLFSLPIQFFILIREIKNAELIHVRGPSVPALIALITSFVFPKKIFWYKYAGDWNEKKTPLAFCLQRWILLHQRRKNVYITINGHWENLHDRFLIWENPCLTEEELKQASEIVKDFNEKWCICFVGNLAKFKGASRLVNALAKPEIASKIQALWIVGDGEEMESLRILSPSLPYPLHLPGSMPRTAIFSSVYARSHFLVLPSESEGFPKVVAEAAAHRCIPIVTNVSAINQIIQHGFNGFLLKDPSSDTISQIFLEEIFSKSAVELKKIADNARLFSERFTYERFRDKVRSVFIENLQL
ncbi:MAG: glycosyltransferase family 4 protein [Chitinophagales bacterium]|nr:glycosyltransferase family 4 protein [Chitinophagales bacterium]MDW8274335.1 glycosyltransferase family 4 protein [Chitinophagales bacterium]